MQLPPAQPSTLSPTVAASMRAGVRSLLSFHAHPIHFMRLYVARADAWDAFLSVSFLFAIVPIDA